MEEIEESHGQSKLLYQLVEALDKQLVDVEVCSQDGSAAGRAIGNGCTAPVLPLCSDRRVLLDTLALCHVHCPCAA